MAEIMNDDPEALLALAEQAIARVRELCKQDDLDMPVVVLASDVLDALDGEQ